MNRSPLGIVFIVDQLAHDTWMARIQIDRTRIELAGSHRELVQMLGIRLNSSTGLARALITTAMNHLQIHEPRSRSG